MKIKNNGLTIVSGENTSELHSFFYKTYNKLFK